MIYIFETEIQDKKSVYFALQKIFGLGKAKSESICKKLGFSTNLKVNELTREQNLSLVKLIENSSISINNDLKKINSKFFKNLIEIKAYRGLRRLNNLPVRGQRTHTNARTSKRFKRK